MEKQVLTLGEACALLEKLAREELARRPRLIVALDGRCASGKTTLAGELSRRSVWGVVHMDDFFLRPAQRTPQRYAAPGENVDHERFLEEVLLPLDRGELRSYRPFDCHTLDFGPPVPVASAPVTVVEGAYACHPALWDFYGLRVFLTVEGEEQLRRVEARNGEKALAAFRDRWIPLEEAYIAAQKLEERCDCVIELKA